MQVLEKKRPREEKDIVQRLKPLAKLQTADDYDNFVDGILCKSFDTGFLLRGAYAACYLRGSDSSKEDTGITTLPQDGLESSGRHRAV